LHLEFDEATIIDLVLDEFCKICSGQKILEPANRFGQAFESLLARVRGLSREEFFRRHEPQLRRAIIGMIVNAKALIPALLHPTQRSLLRDARGAIACGRVGTSQAFQ
jgi:hypothetical protein